MPKHFARLTMGPRRYRSALLLSAVGCALAIIAGGAAYITSRSHLRPPMADPRSQGPHSASSASTSDPSARQPTAADTPAPKPAEARPPAPPAAPTPSSVLGLANWRLALPIDTGHAGSPDQIDQPELAGFSLEPYFFLSSDTQSVIFRAAAGGATTDNSSYPRSELREMTNNGSQRASWSNTNGTHTMTIRQAITHLPTAKPEVVAGQIHDANDDVIMIRLEGTRLFVEGDGEDRGLLAENYALGTVFTVKIVASDGHIRVYYNDVLKVDYTKSGSGYYFKAGCYTQSNTSKGDTAAAYGEVIIYSLQVTHH